MYLGRNCTFLSSVRNLILTLTILIGGAAHGAPPHPNLIKDGTTAKAAQPFFLSHLNELHDKGYCAADNPFAKDEKPLNAAKAAATGPFRILALLVDFSDHTSSVNATFFDSLIFDSSGQTVRDFYNEISYGQLDLVTLNLPSSTGWLRAPQTYDYYVDGQSGTGTYPRNTQKLVEELVDLANPVIDFSNYDNNNDGLVDILMVIHSGVGAEYAGGSADEIWSHKYAINPRAADGVYVSSYTIQPEFWAEPGDMTIGVYAHELGHAFGLPDLYDIDYSSNGIGRWGLMSFGAWNGSSNMGESPSHPCAWSRIEMGFLEPVDLSASLDDASLTDVASGGTVYRLGKTSAADDEYFLIENRAGSGYDSRIPSTGLLIWHIDDAVNGNRNEYYPGLSGLNHFQVALEQADGFYDLEQNRNYGDNGDPFPGSSLNRDFFKDSSPSSLSYSGVSSEIAVMNIFSSGGTVTTDIVIDETTLSTGGGSLPQTLSLSQNYPNPFNPTTIIEFNINRDGQIKVEIFNTLGQLVRGLYDGPLSAGSNQMVWDSFDNNGKAVASGVYFYRVSNRYVNETKKMLLAR